MLEIAKREPVSTSVACRDIVSCLSNDLARVSAFSAGQHGLPPWEIARREVVWSRVFSLGAGCYNLLCVPWGVTEERTAPFSDLAYRATVWRISMLCDAFYSSQAMGFPGRERWLRC